jgi:hypothetical protein
MHIFVLVLVCKLSNPGGDFVAFIFEGDACCFTFYIAVTCLILMLFSGM